MGVLNITPDSFSDGGQFNEIDSAILHVDKMLKNGADIIDIGGESTKPGSKPVSSNEELRRIVPIIKAIKNEYKDILISVDTYKSSVAKKAIEAGADFVNDISGLTFDDEMISKINSIRSNKISMKEQLIFYVKFTLRLKIKYFLYRFFPPLYVKFDKLF